MLLTQEIKVNSKNAALNKGLIGVGVEVQDFSKFKIAYEKAIKLVFQKHKHEFLRPVYCSKDISALFEYESINEEIKILSEFKDLVIVT